MSTDSTDAHQRPGDGLRIEHEDEHDLLIARTAAEEGRAIVLVEGISDKVAIDALATRRGHNLDLEGITIVAIGGATKIWVFLQLLGPLGLNVKLAGLCDVGEERHFRKALERASFGSNLTRASMETLGFYICDADLEDELIRSLGVDAVLEVIATQGDLGRFQIFQRQPEWQNRSKKAQLRRWLGTTAHRKVCYAELLANALDLDRVPVPLERVLAHVAARITETLCSLSMKLSNQQSGQLDMQSIFSCGNKAPRPLNRLMRKFLLPLFLATTVVLPSLARCEQTDDELIVPGKRIGEWRLGANAQNPEPTLALPDWLIYIRFHHRPGVRARLRPTTIALHKVSNRSLGVEPADGFTVDLIYVDGGAYHTANGYSNYSDQELKRLYPQATPSSENPKIYDDKKQGIAFEFGTDAFAKSCVGIMVHLPGRPAFATLDQVMDFRKQAGY